MARWQTARGAIAPILAVLVAAGCAGTPGTTTRLAHAAHSPLPASVAPASPTSASATASPSAGPASPSPSPLVASTTAPSLSGLVRGPATLISDQGGQIISDLGSGLISNNGGSLISDLGSGLVGKTKLYRLAAIPDQQPLAGLTVHLLDGAGQPVLLGGQPAITTSDADGHYAFAVAPKGDNWFVQADLPHGHGTLAAIVPKSGDLHAVDVDVVSALTSGYIWDQYVHGQPNPQATLDKLPPEVEAETRNRAATALASGAVALPDALTPRRVVETVNSLRQGDGAFNAQMETVRNLLIAAGQSTLGEGHKATDVSLSTVRNLALALDGTLYVNCAFDRRIWRVGTDGLLQTAAGNGKAQLAAVSFGKLDPIDGLKGPDADLIAVRGVAFDSLQRLLILEYENDMGANVNTPDFTTSAGGEARVSRLEPDGTLTTLWDASQTGKAVVAGTNGEVLVLTGGMGTEPAKLVAIKADKTREERFVFDQAGTDVVRATEAFGRDPAGRIYLGTRTGSNPPGFGYAVYRFEPAAKTLEKLADTAGGTVTGLALDGGGAIFSVDAAGHLMVQRPDGSPATKLLDALPAGMTLTMFTAVALAPDGTAYIRVENTRVYRIANGALVPVAGTPPDASGNGSDVALVAPFGVAVATNSDYFVADAGKNEIIRYTAAGQASVYAGTGTAGYADDGVAAAGAPLSNPHALRLDAAGTLYAVEIAPALAGADPTDPFDRLASLCIPVAPPMSRVRATGPDGKARTVYQAPGQVIADLAVAGDGTLYLALDDVCANTWSLVKQPPGGAPVTLVAPAATSIPAIALATDGTLFASYGGHLAKLVDTTLAALPAAGWAPTNLYYAGTLAVDAVGKLYVTVRTDGSVFRYSPGTNTYEAMAGPNAPNFSGTAVNDSLKDPRCPTFGPDGALYFADTSHKQVKKLPADKLMMGFPIQQP